MTTANLRHRFKYHPPKDDQARHRHEDVRAAVGEAADELDFLLPDGREKSLTLTKLEEAMFWANAAIARHGSEPWQTDAAEPLPPPVGDRPPWQARARLLEGDRVRVGFVDFNPGIVGNDGTVVEVFERGRVAVKLDTWPFEDGVSGIYHLDRCEVVALEPRVAPEGAEPDPDIAGLLLADVAGSAPASARIAAPDVVVRAPRAKATEKLEALLNYGDPQVALAAARELRS